MSPTPIEPIEEDHILEGDEEDPILETNVPELPSDLRAIMLTDFPPGNKRSSGFSHTLIELMIRADNYNMARLFEAFPVYGVAFMLFDEALVEYSQDNRTVTWKEAHADKASILEIPSWHERCRTLQSVLNYSRTSQGSQIISTNLLAAAKEYGSY